MKYIIILLIIINCKPREKVIYKYDYCSIEAVHLTKQSKEIEPMKTRQAIVDNNILYYCNCKYVVAPAEFNNLKLCE